MLHHVVSYVDDDVMQLHVLVTHDETKARTEYERVKEADPAGATFASYEFPCFAAGERKEIIPGVVVTESRTLVYGKPVYNCVVGVWH